MSATRIRRRNLPVSKAWSKRFGEAVRWERKRAGKSQRSLATLIGISHATLSRIERGEEMTVPSFAKICAHFNMPPENWLCLAASEQ